MKTTINAPVTITAIGFGRDMRVVPRRMEYAGQIYTFIDRGIRTIVRRGEHTAQILTMSDGQHDFHLRSDNYSGSWTLLSIS